MLQQITFTHIAFFVGWLAQLVAILVAIDRRIVRLESKLDNGITAAIKELKEDSHSTDTCPVRSEVEVLKERVADMKERMAS